MSETVSKRVFEAILRVLLWEDVTKTVVFGFNVLILQPQLQVSSSVGVNKVWRRSFFLLLTRSSSHSSSFSLTNRFAV